MGALSLSTTTPLTCKCACNFCGHYVTRGKPGRSLRACRLLACVVDGSLPLPPPLWAICDQRLAKLSSPQGGAAEDEGGDSGGLAFDSPVVPSRQSQLGGRGASTSTPRTPFVSTSAVNPEVVYLGTSQAVYVLRMVPVVMQVLPSTASQPDSLTDSGTREGG